MPEKVFPEENLWYSGLKSSENRLTGEELLRLLVGPSNLFPNPLHLFGAKDYYDPFGDLPERKKLAEQVCPNDVMLNNVVGDTRWEISDITAYTVGWLQELPDTVKDPLWFQ